MSDRACSPLLRLHLLAGLVMLAVVSTLSAAELPPAPEGSFSIVVIPDTQHYHGRGTKANPQSREELTNPVFAAWTKWIANNVARQRIAFVTHVGDIVDKNNREQWHVARQCMDELHGRVPYGISPGNHDMTASGDASLFQEVFGKERFSSLPWYAGCFDGHNGNPRISGNNANSVQLFEAAGLRFVILHVECNAPDDVLSWVDSVLEKHSDRRALITTHMGLGPAERPRRPQDYFDAHKGRMRWKKRHGERGNTPQQMWDKCFRKHENLFMICCGDQSRTQALRQRSSGDHGNTVYELLSDYGTAGLRVMRFIPRQDKITVTTWDPIRGKPLEATKIVPDRKQHQFELTYRMNGNQR